MPHLGDEKRGYQSVQRLSWLHGLAQHLDGAVWDADRDLRLRLRHRAVDGRSGVGTGTSEPLTGRSFPVGQVFDHAGKGLRPPQFVCDGVEHIGSDADS